MPDEIIELLKNKKLRKKVVETIESVYHYAGTLYDNPTEDMEEAVDLWEEAWWRAEVFGHAERIEQAFEKYVFDKMPRPYVVTIEELLEHLFSLANPGKTGYMEGDHVDFNDVYAIFINSVNNHILLHRSSAPFPICIVHTGEEFFRGFEFAIRMIKGSEFASKIMEGGSSDRLETLWCKSGISLEVVGESYHSGRYCGTMSQLCACFEGDMSNLVCERLREELSRILPSVIRSISLITQKDISKIKRASIKGIPLSDEQWISDKRYLIKRCLDAYYSKPMKKDSIERRIRNAVHLLIESDAQSNDAVGLALSVAAIDALLGEKGKDMVEKLSTNVAVLLEPDLEKRGNAKNFVRDIYDLRSRALHGEKIETESYSRIKARHLAAGVLAGIVSHRDFLSRAGYDPERPNELLKDLRESQFTPGQPIGVEESNVGELWSGS